jgi:dihydroflavonol-4-reductase
MIVVTGASGLIGANLVRALLAEQGERQVRGLVHQDRRALMGLNLDLVQADLSDRASLERAFNGADVVYHLAASISLRMDSWETVAAVNLEGTRNVLEACRHCGVRRLVYFSSIHTRQQAPLDQPLDESRPLLDDPEAPPYERSKAAAEQEVQQAFAQGLDVVTIIPTAVIGPYDFKPSYIGKALLLLAQGNLPALVSGGYDWVDVRDVVAGAMQAARLAPSGSSYILSGHWHSIPEVARQVDRIIGRRLTRPVVPLKVADWAAPLMLRVGRLNGSQPLYTRAMLTALTSNRLMSCAKATRELGYTARPFRQTLEDTLQWLLEYHRLPKESTPVQIGKKH